MNGKGCRRRPESKPGNYSRGWERLYGDKKLARALLQIVDLWWRATGKVNQPRKGQLIKACHKVRRD